jgi:hypothetical protein
LVVDDAQAQAVPGVSIADDGGSLVYVNDREALRDPPFTVLARVLVRLWFVCWPCHGTWARRSLTTCRCLSLGSLVMACFGAGLRPEGDQASIMRLASCAKQSGRYRLMPGSGR